MRGAFFFKEGKLVNAHMGSYSGFHAVNLALSIGRVSLSFDSSIPTPHSNFKVSAERETLKRRVGIEIAVAETNGQPKIIDEPTPKTSQQAQVNVQPKVIDELPLKTATSESQHRTLRSPDDDFGSEVFSLFKGETWIDWKSIKFPLVSLFQRLTDSLPRQRLVALLGLVALTGFVVGALIIPAILGLAPYSTKSSEAKPRDVSTIQGALEAPAATPVEEPSPENEKQTINQRTPVFRQSSPNIRTDHSETTRAIKREKTQTPNESAGESASTSMVKGPPVEPAKPLAETIAVVVEVNEGHVIEAYIKAPQSGRGAYEATALRLARQRRFPKETNGKEIINLKVTGEP